MEHTIEIMLRQGALNDDVMLVADEGYHFGKNPNYKVCVKYYTFANEWCNHEHHFYATSIDNALKRYEQTCGKLDDEERESVEIAIECIEYEV